MPTSPPIFHAQTGVQNLGDPNGVYEDGTANFADGDMTLLANTNGDIPPPAEGCLDLGRTGTVKIAAPTELDV
ncbi:MAG: hypothetical protein AAFY14_05725 [Pseudomonadota bacterium]